MTSSLITSTEGCDTTLPPLSSTTSPPPPVAPEVAAAVLTPCAACKILRRKCANKCALAPYFPPSDPVKFTIAHRIFGASNIIKLLQDLPEFQRTDAVNSIVYEANVRLKDPVYGCAGAISQLQNQVNQLQAQLAKAQAEVVKMQCQQANLMPMIYMEMAESPQQSFNNSPQSLQSNHSSPNYFDDDNSETLWTDSLWA